MPMTVMMPMIIRIKEDRSRFAMGPQPSNGSAGFRMQDTQIYPPRLGWAPPSTTLRT